MILNQGLLRLRDRLFDRVELLGDVQAVAAALQHLDHAAQMPVGPLQALDDLGMRFVPTFARVPVLPLCCPSTALSVTAAYAKSRHS